MKYINIPESITEIQEFTFYHCKSLHSVTIPSAVTKVGHWAFSRCESLEAVTIQSFSTEFGDGVFAGCKKLSSVAMPQSVPSFGNGVFGGCENLPQQNKNDFLSHQQQSINTMTPGPGPDLEFKGETQEGWGPEWWGVSLEQIQQMKEHPFYKRRNSSGKTDFLMREYVQSTIEPLTEGTGLGYALFMNREKPLKARVMVSHAWDEPICDFLEAIERSGEEGPFWICALSIYQNHNPDKGVTIGKQLGSDPKFGPFATVLRCAELMLAVLTHECDIYTRLWCVYELFFAVTNDVNVRLAPHITENNVMWGHLEKDICISEAKNRVKSVDARCGRPGSEMNDDELAIRKEISSTAGEFTHVDEVVEQIRLVHLLSYPMEKVECNKNSARDNIKDAIESIIPCFASNTELKSFDNFLAEKLLAYPGFKRDKIKRVDVEYDSSDHDYIISDGVTKHDVFKEWCSILCEALPNVKP